jgi:hypothetical protein
MDSKDKIFEYIMEKSDFGWFIGELGTNRDGTLYMILDDSFTKEYDTDAKVAGAFRALTHGLEVEFDEELYGFDIQWDSDEEGIVDASIDYADLLELAAFIRTHKSMLTRTKLESFLKEAQKEFTNAGYERLVDMLYDAGIKVDEILNKG